VAIGRVGLGSGSGSGSGGLDRVSLIKKICQVMGRVRVDSMQVGSGFRSNTIGFLGSRVISGRAGLGFAFL
jgi:hypothetical protein